MNPHQSTIPPEALTHMAHALRLAGKGIGRTDPNPMVGAVIVKGDAVVGRGFHRAPGKPHAEVEAIADAGENARGAGIYVTLEPCNHFGRTPPCTQAILEAGITTVWYGMADPNPVAGGGAQTLESAGVQVHGPILEDECARLNEVFVVNVTEKRPFVFLKLAMSLDGRIATHTGQSQWITCEKSRAQVHELRDRVSAVMVGIGTVLADDPSLTTRLPEGRGVDPVRIVADSTLRTPPDFKVVKNDSPAGVIIACRKDPPDDRMRTLERAGARILTTRGTELVDLTDLMSQAYDSGITSILLEGGAGMAWAALEAQIVDRCLFFYAPKIIGGAQAPSGVGGRGVDRLDRAPRLVDVEVSRSGPDILVSGRVTNPGPAPGHS